MVLWSIEIPAVHGKYLREVLESIRQQSFQDYEVIVVNSGTECISDLVKQYGFKEIRAKVALLKARYLAHKSASGRRVLLLDETRLLRKRALEILSKIDSDMVVVGKREIGDSIWIRLAQLDKYNILVCNKPDPLKGFALPRVFSAGILSQAFELLKKDLGEKFDYIISPDHALIYYSASRISNNVSVLREELIFHYGDKSLREIVRKYYRYGKSSKILNGTKYESLVKISMKRRNICRGNKFLLYLLYIIRGVPYIIGKNL